VVITAKDLTDEDCDRLNGGVERIIQKSNRDEMLRNSVARSASASNAEPRGRYEDSLRPRITMTSSLPGADLKSNIQVSVLADIINDGNDEVLLIEKHIRGSTHPPGGLKKRKGITADPRGTKKRKG
jgi:hypothetical protein